MSHIYKIGARKYVDVDKICTLDIQKHPYEPELERLYINGEKLIVEKGIGEILLSIWKSRCENYNEVENV